jgi:7-carboxy-7-deazaguanine synthase (Cx14CxxC type)
MSYHVKEIFHTLQGEGVRAGRASIFVRFTGCNLWSGIESDRESSPCKFCDTDFVGTNGPRGGRFETPQDLAHKVRDLWDRETVVSRARPYVVCTGGEPLLQLDTALVEAFHSQGFEVAVETNGTLDAPSGIDWLCVSPKGLAPLKLKAGDELKLVYYQDDAPPERFEALAFDHFLLQPMDGPLRHHHTEKAVNYCLAHPQWTLSLQTHKWLGIP